MRYEDSMNEMEESSYENNNTMTPLGVPSEDEVEYSMECSITLPGRYHSQSLEDETSSQTIAPPRIKSSPAFDDDDDDDDDGLRQSASPNFSPRPIMTQRGDTERLIVRPAKENAYRKMRGYLDSWFNGNLNVESLQTGIRNSLSDVLLNRQMQTALVQSGISASPAQQGSAGVRKRRAHELDD